MQKIFQTVFVLLTWNALWHNSQANGLKPVEVGSSEN